MMQFLGEQSFGVEWCILWHRIFHSGRVLIFALPMPLSHHRPLVSFSCLVECSGRVVPNGRGRETDAVMLSALSEGEFAA
jgi:hypothetical protein